MVQERDYFKYYEGIIKEVSDTVILMIIIIYRL